MFSARSFESVEEKLIRSLEKCRSRNAGILRENDERLIQDLNGIFDINISVDNWIESLAYKKTQEELQVIDVPIWKVIYQNKIIKRGMYFAIEIGEWSLFFCILRKMLT